MNKLQQIISDLNLKPPPEPAAVCRRCGQELKDPKSIARGIGPICLGKEIEESEDSDADSQDEE